VFDKPIERFRISRNQPPREFNFVLPLQHSTRPDCNGHAVELKPEMHLRGKGNRAGLCHLRPPIASWQLSQ
jgi:hypothetical protein